MLLHESTISWLHWNFNHTRLLNSRPIRQLPYLSDVAYSKPGKGVVMREVLKELSTCACIFVGSNVGLALCTRRIIPGIRSSFPM